MYLVARWLGRPSMLRWGRYFLVRRKIGPGGGLHARYEAGGVFFARFLPVIRHLISIPAGIMRMGFVKFSVLTLVGVGGLVLYPRVARRRVGANLTPAQLAGCRRDGPSDKSESFSIVVLIVLVSVLYFVVMRLTAPKRGAGCVTA